MVGFGNVAALARESGIKSARGTPSVSIGAYDATPLDMAGAYTVFANSGVHISPFMVASVRSTNGDPIDDYSPETRSVLDPRVSYLVTDMLENVVNAGTGAEVRRFGFEAIAAGKTGTSHDAWFAGYTSNLLCVVWVGNDDYTDIEIEGAKAAAPIWAEFMKRAITLPQYSDVKPFSIPQGVELVTLDKATNLLADSTCPEDYTAAFLDGTAPTESCELGGVDQSGLTQRILSTGGNQNPAALADSSGTSVTVKVPVLRMKDGTTPDSTASPEKKHGFFGKIFGKKNSTPTNTDPATAPSQ
jgi:penicillin-binding protein 1B